MPAPPTVTFHDGVPDHRAPVLIFVWVRPGDAAPAGYRFSGVVSRRPDTGRVRAELWERSE